jgi:hypothetical protein
MGDDARIDGLTAAVDARPADLPSRPHLRELSGAAGGARVTGGTDDPAGHLTKRAFR